MRKLMFIAFFLSGWTISWSQKTKVPAKKYPSLLWEITGPGIKKPSYLFGTMHVSSKMVFHLSDSFYIGLKNADVVALETDMGTWQDDFSKYDMMGENLYGLYGTYRSRGNSPTDYFTLGALKFPPYEKLIEVALYSNPTIINNFLYRSHSEKAADFEEDTYLDMHIYQAGKKWGKKVLGVENFDESMELMKEAYKDAAKEKNKKERSYDFDEDLSYAKLEDAYRTGNLDWLDSINKINSTSAAFDEKFLYKRNEIQAKSIDSILKSKSSLFVGVGAAHLPGERGVIEMLRKMGYRLRPIKMNERDSKHKDEVEKIRVPVTFQKQSSSDRFFTVSLPGKLYEFNSPFIPFEQEQFSDMSNGSYYVVTRIKTNSLAWGHSEDQVLRKIDSVMYENVPGKILSKKEIVKNGYKGFEVVNRTRRGDYQRYNIFATPFEVILFKMSGNGDYVKGGTEADQFFNSIELKAYSNSWQKWSPSFGGFEVEFPHEPVVSKNARNWQFMAMDNNTKTSFAIVRTEIHNYDFVEEDTFDLSLMEESFAGSDFIDQQQTRQFLKVNGYPALDAKYKYKDGSIALVRFLIHNTHYYTLIAHGRTQNPKMGQFIKSFGVKPFHYEQSTLQSDTSLFFTVKSPVPLEKTKKLSMYPEDLYSGRYGREEEDDSFEEQTTYKTKLVASDSTGEKIFISFSKPSRYYYDSDSATTEEDSTHFTTDKLNWSYRSRKVYELPNKTKVFEYVLGDPKSSRYIQGKLFSRDGVNYRLETQGDTISKTSSFISGFFESFTPSDTVKGTNTRERKSSLFFKDFFSKDTLLHKRAVKNIGQLFFDSTDLPQIKKAIQTLTWKEKKYLDVKKAFVWELSFIKTNESADFLKSLYFAAGDTVELQYTALEALLMQRTAYSYQVFKDIMVTDPPVLDVENNSSHVYPTFSRPPVVDYNGKYYPSYDEDYGNEFLDNLGDSLELTASIFKDLLPLMNINDYEQPMMDLLGTLVDSSLVTAMDYEMYQSKFLLEAKQLLKKQIIIEKTKEIEKAQKNDEDEQESYYYRNDKDYGNSQLSLYATLLMPFWDKNPAVPQLIQQLLNSNDKKLKYNTVMLLLHNKKTIPDTMFSYFAAMDDYRYDLYSDLKKKKKLNLFPGKHNNHISLAKSELLSMGSYNKPDTMVYVDRLPVQHKDRSGFVYFFKYKQKKDDNFWKLASVGIVPADAKKFEFDEQLNYYEEKQFDFTETKDVKLDEETPIKDQLKKALKKMQYSKRNSAAEFYSDEEKDGLNMFRMIDFGD